MYTKSFCQPNFPTPNKELNGFPPFNYLLHFVFVFQNRLMNINNWSSAGAGYLEPHLKWEIPSCAEHFKGIGCSSSFLPLIYLKYLYPTPFLQIQGIWHTNQKNYSVKKTNFRTTEKQNKTNIEELEPANIHKNDARPIEKIKILSCTGRMALRMSLEACRAWSSREWRQPPRKLFHGQPWTDLQKAIIPEIGPPGGSILAWIDAMKEISVRYFSPKPCRVSKVITREPWVMPENPLVANAVALTEVLQDHTVKDR